MALLLLVTLVIGYVAYRDNRAAVIPPTPGTPTVVATPATHAWPTWGGNAARTRNMPGPAPLGQPVVLWTFPASGESGIGQIVDGATIVDGVLYVPGTSGFAALEAATGRELWRTTEVGGIGFIDGDGIVLRSAERSGNGYDLIRINRTDGSIAWRTEQGQIGDPWGPVVADGVGYVPSGTDLLAFDPATGNTVWRVPLGTPASRGVSEAGGLVVVGNQNGTVYGISVAGHDVVWKYETGSVVVGHPSLVGGTVYVFGRGGAPGAAIYALNAATGALEWRFAVPSGAILSNVAIGDGTVYTMSSDGEVYALDVATGADRWTFHIGAGGDANSPVLIGDDLFLVGGSGILYAVDATAGTERWHVSLGSHSTFTPVVVDGIAYVGTDMGTVLAIGGSGSAATPTR
jgi:outer membrane protein assembly factor BamB